MNDEIRKQIKKLVIQTKRLMQEGLTGDYISAFKGSGLEFEQIREYQMGDDIRRIDWNSSAKMNKIMIKQFVEERDRTVILAIDISKSNQYSSQKELKKDTIAQVATALAYVAAHNKDRVGAVFFSDRIEQWIAPARGRAHLGKIIETIFSLDPVGTNTNIGEALRFLIGLKKRNVIVFMLSDWIDTQENYAQLLRVANCKFDFIGVRFLDDCEKELPSFGLLDVEDSETGHCFIIDIRKQHNSVNRFFKERIIKQDRLFSSCKINALDLTIGRPFISDLVAFFRQRIRRQI